MALNVRFAAFLVCIATAVPLTAQRGGGHAGGGQRAGFAGRPAAAPAMNPVPRFGSGIASYGVRNIRPVSPSTAAALRRAPTLADSSRFDIRERHFRRDFAPFFGYGLPWTVGWIPDVLDYPDEPYPQSPPIPAYSADPGPAAPPAAAPEPEQQIQPTPASSLRAPYVRQAPAAPEPADLDPLTLVFKDGRPNEQIRNYMITRTALYIRDGRTRVIPIDDIDVAATQKANQDAGLDFEVPGRS